MHIFFALKGLNMKAQGIALGLKRHPKPFPTRRGGQGLVSPFEGGIFLLVRVPWALPSLYYTSLTRFAIPDHQAAIEFATGSGGPSRFFKDETPCLLPGSLTR